MKNKRSISLAIAAGIVLAAAGLTNSMAADPQGKAIGYWTKARMDSAQAIELVVDEKTGVGKIVKTARSTGGSSTSSTSGANWTKGGDPLNYTGKIFFSASGGNYVCSGALVNDTLTGKSLVLTAGHCVWDQAGNSFVTNLIFYPAYQNTKSLDCSISVCISAEKLYVRDEFANQTTFNTTALQNDWGFVVLTGDSSGSFPISFAASYNNGNVSSFGYPAAFPYDGQKLINCQNPIFKDSKTANTTWGMSCNMTGGASGGPWFYPWSTSTPYSGTLFSLNSYKYTGDKSKMYGPMFNSRTSATYNSANSGLSAIGVRSN